MARTAAALRRQGKTIGFVPTMGALHDGHLSLIRAARRQNRVVVISVFVNPLQFGPREDYARYPRDLRHDLNLAKAAGADIVFAPDASQMYPTGFCTSVEVGGLSDSLEGACRPGHFRGVATVVAKLLNLVQPASVYVGQKDYQQALIIQRLIKDLHLPVAFRLAPTVREPDGLAMSSRNQSLTPQQRSQASVVAHALEAAKARIRDGERDARQVAQTVHTQLSRVPAVRVEYVAVVQAKTLEPLTRLAGHVAILVGVRLGTIRLIDNILVDVS